MRKVILLVALFVGAPTTGQTQAATRVRERMAAPEQVVLNIISRVYKDIALTADQRERLKEIIDRSFTDQRTLDFGAADVHEKQVAMLERRNAAMRALLTSDSDRAKFDVNIRLL